MYAVIQIGSAQYKIAEGDRIQANRLDYEIGQDVQLDQVLLCADGENIKVGTPFLKGAKVKVKVLEHVRADKVIAFKYRKRKDSARTHGHRQDLTALEIVKISA